jgi:hypothetical protein
MDERDNPRPEAHGTGAGTRVAEQQSSTFENMTAQDLDDDLYGSSEASGGHDKHHLEPELDACVDPGSSTAHDNVDSTATKPELEESRTDLSIEDSEKNVAETRRCENEETMGINSDNTPTDDRRSSRDPLHILGEKILGLWKKFDDQRTAIALLLREAKERVEAGEDKRFDTFKAWCAEMLPGRNRDIRRLLQRAYAEDPAAEGERQRCVAKESMARTRARRKADQRWTAASSDDVLRAGAGHDDGDAVGPTNANFEQELERRVAFFEQNSDRIAQLQPRYRASLLERLQGVLSSGRE